MSRVQAAHLLRAAAAAAAALLLLPMAALAPTNASSATAAAAAAASSMAALEPRRESKSRLNIYTLAQVLHLSMEDAAKRLQVSSTTLKLHSRINGLVRWPFRVYAAVLKTLRARSALGHTPEGGLCLTLPWAFATLTPEMRQRLWYLHVLRHTRLAAVPRTSIDWLVATYSLDDLRDGAEGALDGAALASSGVLSAADAAEASAAAEQLIAAKHRMAAMASAAASSASAASQYSPANARASAFVTAHGARYPVPLEAQQAQFRAMQQQQQQQQQPFLLPPTAHLAAGGSLYGAGGVPHSLMSPLMASPFLPQGALPSRTFTDIGESYCRAAMHQSQPPQPAQMPRSLPRIQELDGPN